MRSVPLRSAFVIAAAITLGMGGGIALADIPSGDGTITACMLKPGGTIRLINAEDGATCKKTEQKVEWNTAGQDGADGADGVSGYEIVTRDKVPGIGFLGEGAQCPEGKKVVGGGATAIDENGNPVTLNIFNMLASRPLTNGTGWAASWTLTDNSFGTDVRVYAICVTALP